LAAREDHVERRVVDRCLAAREARDADAAHARDPALARDRQLRGRQDAVAHLALGAIEERGELRRVDADAFGGRSPVRGSRHGAPRLRLAHGTRSPPPRRRGRLHCAPMIKRQIDFENASRIWWDAGGQDLWDGIIEEAGASSVVVDEDIAASWLAHAGPSWG